MRSSFKRHAETFANRAGRLRLPRPEPRQP